MMSGVGAGRKVLRDGQWPVHLLTVARHVRLRNLDHEQVVLAADVDDVASRETPLLIIAVQEGLLQMLAKDPGLVHAVRLSRRDGLAGVEDRVQGVRATVSM